MPQEVRYAWLGLGAAQKKTPSAFNGILNGMYRILGKGVTTNFQLSAVGKKYFPSSFLGVFTANVKARDLMRHAKNGQFGYGIVNTDNGKGEHWVGLIYNGKNKFYIYDSFGRKSTTLLPQLNRTIRRLGATLKDTEYDREQKVKEEDCGARAMAWLIFARRHGIREALKV